MPEEEEQRFDELTFTSLLQAKQSKQGKWPCAARDSIGLVITRRLERCSTEKELDDELTVCCEALQIGENKKKKRRKELCKENYDRPIVHLEVAAKRQRANQQ